MINRPGVNVVRRALLNDFSIAHQRNLIRHAHCFVRLMRNQQHGGILSLQQIKRIVPNAIAQTVV